MLVLITPDDERTMRVDVGAAGDFSWDDVDRNAIRKSRWLFIEGYLFGNGAPAWEAVERALQTAKEGGPERRAQVALTLSAAGIAARF